MVCWSASAVALLAEGVDRNVPAAAVDVLIDVALLAEGVDRNIYGDRLDIAVPVALLAEGVDRNIGGSLYPASEKPSPSSRRAWIEISKSIVLSFSSVVALLAEGVDRNLNDELHLDLNDVALLAEGVDRNLKVNDGWIKQLSRPPRGGRG